MKSIAVVLCIFLLVLLVLQVTPLIGVTTATYAAFLPDSGGVGTSVTVNGTIDISVGRYSIGFDIDGDGNSFEAGETIVTGRTDEERPALVDTNFVVPPTFGSLDDNDGKIGRAHNVTLLDDSTGARNYYSTKFYVQTTFNLSASAKTQIGETVPIVFTLDGGDPNSTYQFAFQLTAPDGQIFNGREPVTGKPDTLGHYSTEITYPQFFSTAKQIVGNYTVNVIVSQFSTYLDPPDYRQVGASSATFQIYQNNPPVAKINSIKPNPATAGQIVVFSGSGNYTDATIAQYNWTSSLDGYLSSLASFSKSDLSVGTHTITLQVQDNNSKWSDTVSTKLDITPQQIQNNTAPTSTIESITPNPAVKGQYVSFIGKGADPDGSIAHYSWVSSIDGFLSGDATFSTSTLSVGLHTITFQVEDAEGLSSEPVTTTLTITSGGSDSNGNGNNGGNVVPTAHIDSDVPASVTAGQILTFTGHGIDPDGNIAGYQWHSSIDGIFATTKTAVVSSLSVGTHEISFRVQDDVGAWSDAVTEQIIVGAAALGFDPVVIAVVVGCVAAIGGAAGYSVLRMRHQKSRETKDQQPEIPKIHKLSLNISMPHLVTPGVTIDVPIKVKNTGTATLSNIVLSAFATPGLMISQAVQKIPKLDVGKIVSLSFLVQPEKNVPRGFYTFRLETKSQGFPIRPKSFPIRVCKIGLLVPAEANEVDFAFEQFLQTNLYNFDQLHDFSSLSDAMLKYDLIVVPPRGALSSQDVKNLVSFVHSGQSLILIGEIPKTNTLLMEELFGYSNAKSPSADLSTVRISGSPHPITKEFQPNDFQVACRQSLWQTKTAAAQTLAMHIDSMGGVLAPAVTVNSFGMGRAVHFNFDPVSYSGEVLGLLKSSIDWLLKKCLQEAAVANAIA